MYPTQLPPPLPAVSSPPSSSPLWRGPTSKLTLGLFRYPGAWRLSCRRVSTLSPIYTCSSALTEPAVLERPSVGPQRLCPPSLVWLLGGGGGACAPRGTWCAPSGRRCVGNPEPCNGLSYAWGLGWRHFQRDGNPSPGCSPSGTAPTSPLGSCSTSSRTGTMSAVTGGSAPTYLPVLLLPWPPQYPLPSGLPLVSLS